MADKIDHAAGLEMLVRLGDRVEEGQPFLRVFGPPDAAQRLKPALLSAFQLHDDPPALSPLVAERVQ